MLRSRMPLLRISAILGGCLSLSVLLSSRPTHADVRAFWTAMDNAQASNPKIHQAEALLRAAMENNPKTFAKLLPQANLTAGKTILDESRYSKRDFISHNYSSVVGINLRQSLYNRRNALSYDLSDAVVCAAMAEVESSRQQVALDVAVAAFNWLEAKEVLELGEKYRNLTKRHRKVNRKRQKAGESTITDVDTSSSRAEQAEASYIQSLNTMEKAAIFFQDVVGSPPVLDMTLPELKWQEPLDWQNPEGLHTRILQWIDTKPEIKAAEFRLIQAQYAANIEHSDHYPTLDLNYNASRTWDSELGGSTGFSAKDRIDTQSLILNLNLPLFHGGEISARTREAKNRVENALASLHEVRNLALRDVNQARMEIKNQQAAVIWLSKALQSTKHAADNMEEEFKEGTRTLLELLDVQYELYTLSTTLVRNRYQELMARVRLWHALGIPLRPESATTFATRLHEKTVDDHGNESLVVLASMEVDTSKGTTTLQALQFAIPEEILTDAWDSRLQPVSQKKLDKKQNIAEDKILASVRKLSQENQDSPSQTATSALPGGEMISSSTSPPEELDLLLEVYTSAILADVALSQQTSHAVAKVLRPYLPPMAGFNGRVTGKDAPPIAIPLPASQPAEDLYPSHWPILADGPFLIHLGAFKNELEVQQIAEDLAHENIPSWLDVVHTPDDHKIVRLLVGPFSEYDDVLQAVEALSHQTTLVAGWIHNPYWQKRH